MKRPPLRSIIRKRRNPGSRPPGTAPDADALVLLTVLTAISVRSLFSGGLPVGLDSATQFYPWYSFLGETLRGGELPGWNPHQFSGVPFAADPLSGWTYLPAMVLFTLLPLVPAAKGYLFLHLLLAGTGTFVFSRVVGLKVSGALVAAVSYEFSSYFYVRNVCCFAFPGVMVWLPLALLGAELAVRSRRPLDCLLWCAFAGLAVSQILASWLGQGSYYALLVLGSYAAYRTFIFPPDHLKGFVKRALAAITVGPSMLVFGFGLAAAGLLPRLEYNALSGLAGGYDPDSLPAGGTDIETWRALLLPPSDFYAGAGVLTLALIAPFLMRSSPDEGSRSVPYLGVPYFAALALAAITLSGQGTTLLHASFYNLPLLEGVLPYRPERLMVVFYIGASLLAGAAVSFLAEPGRRKISVFPLLVALFLATRTTLRGSFGESRAAPRPSEDTNLWLDPSPLLTDLGIQLVPGAVFALAAVAGLAAVYPLLSRRFRLLRFVVAGLLVLVVFLDLYGSETAVLEKQSENRSEKLRITSVEPGRYYASTGATGFLQSSTDAPYRYFGYAPRFDGKRGPLNTRYLDPEVRSLQASNRAMVHGGSLQSVQGYNAVHLARYDRYLQAMNARAQNYHDADVFAGGVYSRLLDLLNVRYVVVPDGDAADEAPSLSYLKDEFRLAYSAGGVRVYENPDALPRAWVVHSVRRAEPEKILDLLVSGDVDPRNTALLEDGELPELGAPESRSTATVTSYEPNRLMVETSTDVAGLLVLSEVYYPAWKAYVDGEPAEIHRANYLFRTVEVPAGRHVVEMRYESRTLTLGVVISSVTALVAAGALVAALRRQRCP